MAEEVRNSTAADSLDRQPPAASLQPVHGLRRLVYLALSSLLLGLGLLGVLLPGLPTTPFLLLMSYFLIRSSPRLHAKVMQLPVVGRPVREWRERRGVRWHIKLSTSVMVLLAVGLSLFLSRLTVPMKGAILGLAACGLIVVWRLPTIRDEKGSA